MFYFSAYNILKKHEQKAAFLLNPITSILQNIVFSLKMLSTLGAETSLEWTLGPGNFNNYTIKENV